MDLAPPARAFGLGSATELVGVEAPPTRALVEGGGRSTAEPTLARSAPEGPGPWSGAPARSPRIPSGRSSARHHALPPASAPLLAGAQIVVQAPPPPRAATRGVHLGTDAGETRRPLSGPSLDATSPPDKSAVASSPSPEAEPSPSERSIERLAGLHGRAMASRVRAKTTWRSPAPQAPPPSAPPETAPTIVESDLLHLLQSLITRDPRARRLLREVRAALEDMRRMDHLRSL